MVTQGGIHTQWRIQLAEHFNIIRHFGGAVMVYQGRYGEELVVIISGFSLSIFLTPFSMASLSIKLARMDIGDVDDLLIPLKTRPAEFLKVHLGRPCSLVAVHLLPKAIYEGAEKGAGPTCQSHPAKKSRTGVIPAPPSGQQPRRVFQEPANEPGSAPANIVNGEEQGGNDFQKRISL